MITFDEGNVLLNGHIVGQLRKTEDAGPFTISGDGPWAYMPIRPWTLNVSALQVLIKQIQTLNIQHSADNQHSRNS